MLVATFVWVLIALVECSVAQSVPLSRNYTFCAIIDVAADFRMSYDTSTSGVVAVAVDAPLDGWAAIGISLDGTMDSSGAGSDIMLTYLTEASTGSSQKSVTPHVIDMWATRTAQPAVDAMQNLTVVGGGRSRTRNVVEFYRRAAVNVTAQRDDRTIPLNGTAVNLLWAMDTHAPQFGSAGVSQLELTQHCRGCNGHIVFDFTKSPSANGLSACGSSVTPTATPIESPTPTVASTPIPTTRTYDHCLPLDSAIDSHLEWQIDDINDRVYFHLHGVAGWLALGLSPDGTMDGGGRGSDLWMGYVDSSTCSGGCVGDYWTSQHRKPVYDSVQNVDFASGIRDEATGRLSLEFSRRYVSPDTTADYAINIDAPLWFIFASHPDVPTSSTVFLQHSPQNARAVRINLNAPSPCASSPSAPPPGLDWTLAPVPGDSRPHGAFRTDDGLFAVEWFVDMDGKSVEFVVTGATGGWTAIGFGNGRATMAGSDMYVGWVDDNTKQVYVIDCNALQQLQPPPDLSLSGTNDATVVSGTQRSGSTTLRFRRPTISNDTNDVNIVSGDVYVLFAVGSADPTLSPDQQTLTYDKHVSRGVVVLNLLSPSPSASPRPVVLSDSMRIAHAAMMLFAWLLLVSIGNYVARYTKVLLGIWWFRVHVIVQLLALALVVAAFGVIVSYVTTHGGLHFASAHAVIGIIVFVLAMLQPMIGFIADRLWKPQRETVPVAPDQIHWWLGRLLSVLAFINIYLGLSQYGARTGAYVLVSLSIALVIGATLLAEFYRLKAVPRASRLDASFVAIGRVAAGVKHMPDGSVVVDNEPGDDHGDGEGDASRSQSKSQSQPSTPTPTPMLVVTCIAALCVLGFVIGAVVVVAQGAA